MSSRADTSRNTSCSGTGLQRHPGAGGAALGPRKRSYQSGRDIGDEYRYILERPLASPLSRQHAGAPRSPANPWACGETEAADEELASWMKN